MHINEQYRDLTLLESTPYQYIGRDGTCKKESEPVLKEHLLEVYINDQLTMKLIAIPEFLTELVLGRLLTEGIIHSTDQVKQIYICEYGTRAKVILTETKRNESEDYVEITPSCCTGSHILNGWFQSQEPIRPVSPIPWNASQVFALADRFSDGMPLHQKTWATHSCFLAQGDNLLFQCEDIGRHNAMDKAIGFALRQNIDLHKCIIYSSGRVPTDMAVKAIRAGIPILASKASPSREAVTLAGQYGLTLVCAARRDRMKLFAGTPPVSGGQNDDTSHPGQRTGI